MAKFSFRQAEPGEEEAIFRLVVRRVEWMDQKGLHQWNESNYLEAYPLEYYRQEIGKFYVVLAEGAVAAAVAVFRQDGRWEPDKPALYLHNLVADPAVPGAGGALLDFVEQLARRQGIAALRLDSDINNRQLGDYYQRRGFLPRGQCQDGPYYTGIKREKVL